MGSLNTTMGVISGDCCGMVRYQTVMAIGIVLIVADSALFMINIGNTWSTDLRAPMVQQMRDIAPSSPDFVKNNFVDYPFIWNWLLTANFLVIGFDTFLVISTFLRREMLITFYLVLSLLNIVHTVALVLPTIVISMLDSGIAHTIDQTSQRYEEEEETSQTSEERRNFNGLVLDWYVAHGFAIVAIIAMIIFNIYAWIVINNYRQEVKITGGQDLEAFEKMRQEMRRNERMRLEEERNDRDRERDRY